MASIYDTSATSALNEDAYINKLYDSTLDSQKKTLEENYKASSEQLDAGQQQTQAQTAGYLKRAYVEGAKAAGNSGTTLGVGSGAQAALTLGNQQQANVTALKDQQSAADAEYERLRSLLAEKYTAQIKQAQADNDMNRAQTLYEAAKAEEEQLRALRQSAASLMAGKGDYSIANAIAGGQTVTPDTKGETWAGVTRNEEAINKIYDSQMESQRQEAQMELAQKLSELQAQQLEAQRETDKNLTQTYVDALKKNKSYRETQTAYGQNSGTAAQARLAREAGLMKDLTDLRTLQLGKDAETEQSRAELVRAYGEGIAKTQAENDQNRNQALYDAAEGEEQAQVEEQQAVGNLLAKQNNYSVLGALYGLTPAQIQKLQGQTGGSYVYRKPEEQEEPEDGGDGGTKTFSFIPDGYVGQSSVDAYNYLVKALAEKKQRR